jgi:2-iminoacetate synthase ThiH
VKSSPRKDQQAARDGYEGIKTVLQELIDAGLGSLPGGGGVFDDRVHDEAYKARFARHLA